jgi:hypothetical protein
MRYILIYREGSGEATQWHHESFAAQSNALAKACALIATSLRRIRISEGNTRRFGIVAVAPPRNVDWATRRLNLSRSWPDQLGLL